MALLFPISGVETPLWLPPLVALAISSFTSMAGVSGAFLLLPFQMSVLGFTSPAVSPTNLVFNLVAIPSGVYRYLREGRMLWPLTGVITAGTLPGAVLGGIVRLRYLPDPAAFKGFAGAVLLYMGLRLAWDIAGGRSRAAATPTSAADAPSADWRVAAQRFSWRRYSFHFRDREHTCSTPGVFLLALVVGMVGGVYGIGGGAIIAPFLVAFFRLPVHAIAGATLTGTFLTSLAGVLFYQLAAPAYAVSGLTVAPDWLLGGLFGLGGMAGMYLGARLQRFMPERVIKIVLVVILLIVATRYLSTFIRACF
jgi:uncharacterized membrane protein YfcA